MDKIKINVVLQSMITEIIDLIAPPSCVNCGEPGFPGGVICAVCKGRMHRLPVSSCTRCATPSNERAHGCRRCRGYSWVQDSAVAAFAYDGPARKLVTALKSRRSRGIAEFMARHMAGVLSPTLDVRATVPVPASDRRIRKFGFSQSKLLATALGTKLGIPCADNLLKRCDSERQVGLARGQRLENASKTFAMDASADPFEDVLLVDDVITTCATMASCASVLKGGGARTVHCVAFARTL